MFNMNTVIASEVDCSDRVYLCACFCDLFLPKNDVGKRGFGIQNPFFPIAFLTGGFFSGLCGFIDMKTAAPPLYELRKFAPKA